MVQLVPLDTYATFRGGKEKLRVRVALLRVNLLRQAFLVGVPRRQNEPSLLVAALRAQRRAWFLSFRLYTRNSHLICILHQPNCATTMGIAGLSALWEIL